MPRKYVNKIQNAASLFHKFGVRGGFEYRAALRENAERKERGAEMRLLPFRQSPERPGRRVESTLSIEAWIVLAPTWKLACSPG